MHEGPLLGGSGEVVLCPWWVLPRGSRPRWSRAELILPTGADCAEGQGL